MTPFQEARVQALLRLPWTLIPSRDPDDGSLVLRVAELPSVIATGATEDEVDKDLWDALYATLASFVVDGEEVPLPSRARARDPQPPRRLIVMRGALDGDAWDEDVQDATSTIAPARPTPNHGLVGQGA